MSQTRDNRHEDQGDMCVSVLVGHYVANLRNVSINVKSSHPFGRLVGNTKKWIYDGRLPRSPAPKEPIQTPWFDKAAETQLGME